MNATATHALNGKCSKAIHWSLSLGKSFITPRPNVLAQAGRAEEPRQSARRNPALPAANGWAWFSFCLVHQLPDRRSDAL
jgi:hypothetical protein